MDEIHLEGEQILNQAILLLIVLQIHDGYLVFNPVRHCQGALPIYALFVEPAGSTPADSTTLVVEPAIHHQQTCFQQSNDKALVVESTIQ